MTIKLVGAARDNDPFALTGKLEQALMRFARRELWDTPRKKGQP